MYVQEKLVVLKDNDHFITHNEHSIVTKGNGPITIIRGANKLFVGTEEEVDAKLAELGLPDNKELIQHNSK